MTLKFSGAAPPSGGNGSSKHWDANHCVETDKKRDFIRFSYETGTRTLSPWTKFVVE